MDISSDHFATYAESVTFDALPDEVVTRTERLILDSIGCVVGGYASPPSKLLRRLYRDRDGADHRATVMGSGDQIDLEYAALINAAMGRYLDFNDCYVSAYSGGHPSDHIPPLIAVAESEHATGAELIEAVVLAYDIQCRGIESGAVYVQGLDYQAVWGAYSAAAAVGKLMRLTKEELISAMGISGTTNNGLLIARRGAVSMWKSLSVPYVIHNAIQACQMARSGLTGPADVFGGPGGVFDAITSGNVEFTEFSATDHRVMRTNIKPYAGCYQALPSVSELIELITEHQIDAESVEAIHVRTVSTCIDSCGGPEKWTTDLTRETADHSLPYMLAVSTLDRELTPRQYETDRLQHPLVHAIMQSVTIEDDAELNRRRKDTPGLLPAIIEIEADGRSYRSEVEYPPGHYERPISTTQHESKIVGLMRGYLTDDQIARIFEHCESMRDLDTVDPLLEAISV